MKVAPVSLDLWEILANLYQTVENTAYGNSISSRSGSLLVLRLVSAQAKGKESW